MQSTQHYQAVIFDFDDTLVQAGPVKWAQHKAVAKEYYDRDLTDDTLAKYWGMPFDQMIELLHDHVATADELRPAYVETAHRFPKHVFPDAVRTITRLLDSGRLVAVLSAMNTDEVVADLLRFGFPVSNLLFVQGAGDTPVHKPDPGVFSPALASLATANIAPVDVLYVGDAITDYYAARDAGISFIGVATGFTRPAQFASLGLRFVPNLSLLAELLLDSSASAPQGRRW